VFPVISVPPTIRALRNGRGYRRGVAPDIEWLSTAEAAARLGITPRTLYRFLDEGQLPGYRFGRVIRLQAADVDAFIERSRIEPGSLEHLYPDPSPARSSTTDDSDT
jgi:excisionase family DNA binding protein